MKKLLLSGMIGAFLMPVAHAGVFKAVTFPVVHPKLTWRSRALKPVRHAGRDIGRVFQHAAKDAKSVAY